MLRLFRYQWLAFKPSILKTWPKNADCLENFIINSVDIVV